MKLLQKLKKLIFDGYCGGGIAYVCNNEVLMQLRSHPRVWAFIGGGFDKESDKDYLDTALREFYEETGVHLDRSQINISLLHALGFWHYRWELYLVVADRRISTESAPESFSQEYQKYKYVDLYNYKASLSEEKYRKLFPFVRYQLNLIKKRLIKM